MVILMTCQVVLGGEKTFAVAAMCVCVCARTRACVSVRVCMFDSLHTHAQPSVQVCV